MHVNLMGVIEKREFFQRDNFLRLRAIRKNLVQQVERLHNPEEGPGQEFNLRNFRNIRLVVDMLGDVDGDWNGNMDKGRGRDNIGVIERR